MKATRQVWISLLVLLLAVSLAACSRSKDSANSGSGGSAGADTAPSGSSTGTAAQDEDPFKEHMDISLAYWDIGPAMQNPEKDEMLQYLQKKFNITIKPVPITWSDYGEKIKIWAAAGELPDIFNTDLGDSAIDLYEKWAKQGVIRALPDDMSKYPHLADYLNSPDLNYMKMDGKFYMYPRYTYPTVEGIQTDRTIVVRKDWMEKLGIPEPQSFDEYLAMLKRFVNEDPDGNGVKDTIGVTGWSAYYIPYIVQDELPNYGSSWTKQDDGKWVPDYASEKFVEALKRMRRMYTEGVLYKDFSIEKNNVEKFAQGKIGSLSYSVYPGHLLEVKNAWTKYNDTPFTDAVAFLKTWPSSDGKRYRFTSSHASFWSESYFNGKVDDAKMDRILRLYDFLQSPEGRRMLDYGVEGKDYTLNGDAVTVTRAKNDKGEYVALSDQYPSINVWYTLVSWAQEKDFVDNESNRSKFGSDILQMSNEAADWLQKNTVNSPSNSNIVINAIALKYAIPGIMDHDDWIKVVLSKDDPEKMWQGVLKGYEQKGLGEMIDKVNKEAADKGIK